MRQNGGSEDSSQRSSLARRDPVERQKSFPSSYVESTHRHDWFQKYDDNGPRPDPDGDGDGQVRQPGDVRDDGDDVVQSPTGDEDLVQDFVMISSPSDGADGGADDDSAQASPLPKDDDGVREFSPVEEAEEAMEIDTTIPEPENPSARTEPQGLEIPQTRPTQEQPVAGATALSSSPRKFANRGLVYLSEIEVS